LKVNVVIDFVCLAKIAVESFVMQKRIFFLVQKSDRKKLFLYRRKTVLANKLAMDSLIGCYY